MTSIERNIILHYHLFKNAGTSVDDVLKLNFGDKWLTREFESHGGNNTSLVEDWIRESPEGIAYSSHTMVGPLPSVDDVQVVSVMFLRDPVQRIRSAYRFERKQRADTWGARLAKSEDFDGYVQARLESPGDRQCRNFQTHRMASLVPGDEPELERAKRALELLTIVGIVEAFDDAMMDLADRVRVFHGEFQLQAAWQNRTGGGGEVLSEDVMVRLLECNRDDIELFDLVRGKRLRV